MKEKWEGRWGNGLNLDTFQNCYYYKHKIVSLKRQIELQTYNISTYLKFLRYVKVSAAYNEAEKKIKAM